jgi:CBS-domain-containing membrane protein
MDTVMRTSGSILKQVPAGPGSVPVAAAHLVKSWPDAMSRIGPVGRSPLVSDLMSQSVVTVRSDDPVCSAAQLLRSWTISAAPVVDGSGHVVGVVNYGDLLGAAVDRLADESSAAGAGSSIAARTRPHVVAEVMSRSVVSIGPGRTAVQAAELMLRRHLRWLPVMVVDELVGVVSRADLVAALLRDDTDVAEDVEARLVDLAGWPRLAGVSVSVCDGVVTLEGEVPEPSLSAAAARAASEVPGVRIVRDCVRHCAAHTPVATTNQGPAPEPRGFANWQ